MKANVEAQMFRLKITQGLQKAIDKMIERAKLLDEEIVVADKDQNIKYIKARELKR
ncbi:MAG: hypothetical protein MUE30_10520 [Spirosomaceae bacterium]|jgi:hypothetical protein|nr:hypothetical protein [Spirosomataceae bacterium]